MSAQPITFHACPKDISADTLVPERPGEKPESYYRVLVRTKTNKPSGQREHRQFANDSSHKNSS